MKYTLNTKELLTTNEVAKILRVSKHTLHVWRWQKKGPPYTKIGRQALYPANEVEDFINSRAATM